MDDEYICFLVWPLPDGVTGILLNSQNMQKYDRTQQDTTHSRSQPTKRMRKTNGTPVEAGGESLWSSVRIQVYFSALPCCFRFQRVSFSIIHAIPRHSFDRVVWALEKKTNQIHHTDLVRDYFMAC